MVTWPDRPDAQDAAGVEDEAYRLLRSRVNLARLPRFSREVTEGIICASADFGYASDLVCAEDALIAAVAALADGAPDRRCADGRRRAGWLAGDLQG